MSRVGDRGALTGETMNEKPEQQELEASTRRWMLAGLILMGLFVLAFPIFRFYEPAQRADARSDQSAFLAAQGAELYEGSCSSCHGVEGTGAIAPAIGAKEFLESVDDEQIRQIITVGVPGSEMVSYSNDLGGPMTSQEINAVTAYLRSLEEDAVSKPNWRTPLEDENLTVAELYVLACSRCHGVDRSGEEDLAPDISETSFAQEESFEFWVSRISDGYKAMPRFGRILTEEQIFDLVVYLHGPPPPPPTTTTTVPEGGVTTTTEPGATTTTTTQAAAPDPSNDPLLAAGKLLWEETAGGEGCQTCHGPAGNGTPDGPNIIGASRSALRGALGGGVIDMDFAKKLTTDEIDAVYAYMQYLTAQARE